MVHFHLHLRNSKFMVLELPKTGLLLFVRENLITRLLSRHSFPHDIEILFIEFNLRKKKWLICSCYNPHKNLINYHLQELAKGIQIYSNNYHELLLIGDFNAKVSERSFSSFYELHEVKSITKTLQIHRV